ncbi:uncharacterized protein LOC116209061 [Punica granatum]|uniref:Uncharacterized protein LOC116209061 n=1 Tax=Punica granatum TaxID=22663 RepID=A0A6P8DR53_PUNGR|nr:uncharacterized protein LOC116209061 [Punica granatum]
MQQAVGTGLEALIPQAASIKKLATTEAELAEHDMLVWTPHKNGQYTVFSTWKCFRPSKQKVKWRKAVWFAGHLPRSSFVAWLAVRNRLTTRDRMVKWKITLAAEECELCSSHLETGDYLSVTCPVTRGIWKSLLARVGLQRSSPDWDSGLRCISALKGRSLGTVCLKLLWIHYIYCVWKEHNNRIFMKHLRSPQELYSTFQVMLG